VTITANDTQVQDYDAKLCAYGDLPDCGSVVGKSASVTGTVTPNIYALQVMTDTIAPITTCPNGQNCLIRKINYVWVNTAFQQVPGTINIRESFSSKNPANGTTTCSGFVVNTTEACSSTTFTSGFMDVLHVTGACVPNGCGFTFSNQEWWWCSKPSGEPDQKIANIGTLIVHSDSTSVGGNTTGYSRGKTFTP
jgi:hypothetical protein